MDLPKTVTASGLFSKLTENEDLLHAVDSLRSMAGRLVDRISQTLPSFTDHTLRHMDGLWGVTDQVLTQAEVKSLTHGEAFVLACSFYLHDIGMAYAATADGVAEIKASQVYQSFVAKATPTEQSDPEFLAEAVGFAVRKLHADASRVLSTAPIPGTPIYLFESPTIRETWGGTCGVVAASHHMSLDEIEEKLGSQRRVPLPGGQTGDLAYVAAVLRIADFAHINRDRASKTDRAFRLPIARASLLHWLAQEHIDGPVRDGSELVYRASETITDVDAWWLYYEMLKDLDSEIRSVRRYLDRSPDSRGRLALQGVRGAGSPEEAALFVPTAGFLPIEVNVRTGSIEKLVELLAGESLYGPDPMAAVRELIQNARDAVMLKSTTVTSDFDKAALGLPIRLSLRTAKEGATLEVTDFGVGMTQKVMTDYLVSVASDYWTSQFQADFPTALAQGFQPAGRFGIGFLSVFMLGDEVSVESNRNGEDRYSLRLVGVGRRGEIRTIARQAGSGTIVRINLRESVLEPLRALPELVRVYAPMLPHSIEVLVDGETTSVPKGWLMNMQPHDFHAWVLDAVNRLRRIRAGRNRDRDELYTMHPFYRYFEEHRLQSQDKMWPKDWPEYKTERARLLASLEGVSLLSLKGLALQPIATPGFVGIIDVETATPDVSRRRAISADISAVLNNARVNTRAQIIENLCAIAGDGVLMDKWDFVAACVDRYGREVILNAALPWISTLRLPGEVVLASCGTLLERLTKSDSIFIAYGTGPWTAMKKWDATDPHPKGSEVAVVLDTVPRERLPYFSSSDEKTGTLSELWPDFAKSSLFATILHVVGSAWQTNIDQLGQQSGWRLSGSTLWGRHTRL